MSGSRQALLAALATWQGGAVAAGALALASSWTLERAKLAAADKVDKALDEWTGGNVEVVVEHVPVSAHLPAAIGAALTYTLFTYRGNSGPRILRAANPAWRKLVYTLYLVLPLGATAAYVAYADVKMDFNPSLMVWLVTAVAGRILLERSWPFISAYEPQGLIQASGGWWDHA
jgi:hypothetical protein